jgi:hypothetical protein
MVLKRPPSLLFLIKSPFSADLSLSGINDDIHKLLITPQILLAQTMILYYRTNSKGKEKKIKNIKKRYMLAAAAAIIDLINAYGFVLPLPQFILDVDQGHNGLSSILIPDPNNKFLHVSDRDNLVLSNIPAFVGYVCFWVSQSGQLKLHPQPHGLETDVGDLVFKESVPRISIRQFAPKFSLRNAPDCLTLTGLADRLLGRGLKPGIPTYDESCQQDTKDFTSTIWGHMLDTPQQVTKISCTTDSSQPKRRSVHNGTKKSQKSQKQDGEKPQDERFEHYFTATGVKASLSVKELNKIFPFSDEVESIGQVTKTVDPELMLYSERMMRLAAGRSYGENKDEVTKLTKEFFQPTPENSHERNDCFIGNGIAVDFIQVALATFNKARTDQLSNFPDKSTIDLLTDVHTGQADLADLRSKLADFCSELGYPSGASLIRTAIQTGHPPSPAKNGISTQVQNSRNNFASDLNLHISSQQSSPYQQNISESVSNNSHEHPKRPGDLSLSESLGSQMNSPHSSAVAEALSVHSSSSSYASDHLSESSKEQDRHGVGYGRTDGDNEYEDVNDDLADKGASANEDSSDKEDSSDEEDYTKHPFLRSTSQPTSSQRRVINESSPEDNSYYQDGEGYDGNGFLREGTDEENEFNDDNHNVGDDMYEVDPQFDWSPDEENSTESQSRNSASERTVLEAGPPVGLLDYPGDGHAIFDNASIQNPVATLFRHSSTGITEEKHNSLKPTQSNDHTQSPPIPAKMPSDRPTGAPHLQFKPGSFSNKKYPSHDQLMSSLLHSEGDESPLSSLVKNAAPYSPPATASSKMKKEKNKRKEKMEKKKKKGGKSKNPKRKVPTPEDQQGVPKKRAKNQSAHASERAPPTQRQLTYV